MYIFKYYYKITLYGYQQLNCYQTPIYYKSIYRYILYVVFI